MSGLFQSALIISFPILGTLLLVSVAMGLLAKAAPQMDVLTMGFPVSIGVSFLLLFATLPFLMTAMERIIDGSFQTLERVHHERRGRGGEDGEMTADPVLLRLTFPLSTPFDVHLQWFAAEDEGRTEEPSEHKIRKAREEGKVARSAEVSSSLVLLAGIATLGLLGDYMLRSSAEMLRFFLSISASPGAFNGSLLIAFMSWAGEDRPSHARRRVRRRHPGQRHPGGIPVHREAHHPGLLPDRAAVQPWLSRSFASPEALFNFAKSMVKIVADLGHRVPEHQRGAPAPHAPGHVGVPGRSLRDLSDRLPHRSWRPPSPCSPSPPWTTGSRGASTWSP